MEEVMEVNGKTITRDQVRAFLKAKKVILWQEWIITDEPQMERAVDWFMKEVNACAAVA